MFGLFDDFDRQDVKDFLNSGVDYAADLGGDLYEGANDIYDSFSRGTAYDDFTNYLGGLFDDDENPYTERIQTLYPGGGSETVTIRSRPAIKQPTSYPSASDMGMESTGYRVRDESPFMGTDFGYSPKSSSRPKPKMIQMLQDANEMGSRPTVSQSAYGSSAPRGVTAEDQQFMQMLNLSNPEAQMIRRMSQYHPEIARAQLMPDRLDARGDRFAPTIDEVKDINRYLDSTIRDRVKRKQQLDARQMAVGAARRFNEAEAAKLGGLLQ